ncbi:hypothetical protein [Puia dinghuensis]|uniref:Outer membrane protein beta-barrel domain-containing protein n=1 Tax=Puia dinghuensis TaxID=1792502 RepID=A0A8J2UHD9_9BACT|nr:hypothetical protein [Puia dinghuensis]GGB16425.1 hypothetical protein GCM10011511_45310 [Puia dinghuensis]
MTRKVVIALSLWMVSLAGMAQDHMPNRTYTYSDEGPGTGFLKQNLFLGGSLGLGLGSYNFDVGVNPEVGYSLNQWLDVGAVVNFNYTSVKADPSLVYNLNVSSKQFTYGGGLFGRAYVLPFLFLTAQPEFNWTNVKETDMTSGTTYKYNANAPSLLLGVGYGRRMVGESGFYIALLFDVLDNKNSPYNDVYGHPLPVIRAGFDFYLHKR